MAKHECPNCDGQGFHGYDEAGCGYTCYICCETGYVDDEMLATWNAELYVDPEYKRLKPQYLPIYCPNGGDVEWVKRSLLPYSLMPPKRPEPAYYADYDDIPF